MICFLTSRTDLKDTGEVNPANGFAEELLRRVPNPCRALFISSDPDAFALMEQFAAYVRAGFERAGLVFQSYDVLDGRNAARAAELVRDSQLLILSGGHVPTQNRFFQAIGLAELLRSYAGVVVGISAGSMNSAAVVYAQPEEAGEAADPAYRRFLPGLGLTKTMLLPHYHDVKDTLLDGMRLIEDVTLPDSEGKTFYAIPDGSYLFIDGEREELRGEAYRIRDGKMEKIAAEGETVSL